MKTIRFLEERSESKNGGRTFAEGSVHCLEDASAAHWVRRGAAEYVPADVEAEPVAEAPASDPVPVVVETTTKAVEPDADQQEIDAFREKLAMSRIDEPLPSSDGTPGKLAGETPSAPKPRRVGRRGPRKTS